jgi:hypothetical protein
MSMITVSTARRPDPTVGADHCLSRLALAMKSQRPKLIKAKMTAITSEVVTPELS